MRKIKLFDPQLKALLKKDIALLFRKKVAFFIFFGPFLLMFFIIGLPTLLSSTETMHLYVFNEDLGYNSTNIGTNIVGNLSIFYKDSEFVELTVVGSYAELMNTKELGLYIPANFSTLAFTGIPKLYLVDRSQSPYVDQIWGEVNSVASQVVTTTLANRTIPPILQEEIKSEEEGLEGLLSEKAAMIAFPMGYMIFLLVTLNSSSNSLIGFAREKRMRTMEILLAYTKDHRMLVISKTITAIIAALGSTTSYVLGILVGSYLATSKQAEGLLSVFGIDFESITAGAVIVMFLVVILALLIGTSITMALDTNMTREASERLSPLVGIGLAMLFYFVVITNPVNYIPSMIVNPFYWCYRLGLLLIDGKWTWETFTYIILIIALIGILIQISTRGIEKESNLYVE